MIMATWHQVQKRRRALDREARAREVPEAAPQPARQPEPAPPASEPELAGPRQPSPHEQYLERLRRKEADAAARSRAFAESEGSS